MNTSHYPIPEELTLEDIERITRQARNIRSQALAEMGAALTSAVRGWMHDGWLTARAAFSGHAPQKCA